MPTSKRHRIGFLALLLASLSAQAQLRLPAQLPQVTGALPNPASPTDALDRTGATLGRIANAEVRGLLRDHRDVVDTDAGGAPVVRGEIVAIAPTPASLDRLRAAGYAIGAEHALDALLLRIIVVHAPPGVGTRKALDGARAIDPQGAYDFNHLLWRSGASGAGDAAMPAAARADATSASDDASAPDTATARVGLVDGGVDTAHPSLAHTRVQAWGCEGRRTIDAHGTATASLLAGDAVAGAMRSHPVLFAADVYCGDPAGGSAVAVARALDWLAQERVGVINLSLVGPPDALLERAVRAMPSHGFLIVAAVGNDGPAAPPLYPASYPDVIGVTAVNARNRVLPESARGPQVDFAAPGADMVAAAPGGKWVSVRGTSFAAPLVARLAAASMPGPGSASRAAAMATLARDAGDSGRIARDGFGHGLIGVDLRLAQAPSAP